MDCYGNHNKDNTFCQLCKRIDDGEFENCRRDTLIVRPLEIIKNITAQEGEKKNSF